MLRLKRKESLVDLRLLLPIAPMCHHWLGGAVYYKKVIASNGTDLA